jgi:hypothetical protein
MNRRDSASSSRDSPASALPCRPAPFSNVRPRPRPRGNLGGVSLCCPCGLCGRLWRLDEVYEAGELPDLANLGKGKLCPECYRPHYPSTP